MRNLLIILFFHISTTFAQTNGKWITPSAENQILFDTTGCFSLPQLSAFNYLTLSLHPNKKSFESSYWDSLVVQSDVPLSTFDGNDSIATSPSGTSTYIYPEPDLYHYNLHDFNAILCRTYSSESVEWELYRIQDKDTFYLGGIDMDELKNRENWSFISMKRLNLAPSAEFLDGMKKMALSSYEKDRMKLPHQRNGQTPCLVSPLESSNLMLNQHYGANYINQLNPPFANFRVSELSKAYQLEHLNNNYPLVNAYGEDSLRPIQPGQYALVYPKPDTIVYWKEATINCTHVLVKQSISKETLETNYSIEEVYFTFEDNTQRLLHYHLNKEQLYELDPNGTYRLELLQKWKATQHHLEQSILHWMK